MMREGKGHFIFKLRKIKAVIQGRDTKRGDNNDENVERAIYERSKLMDIGLSDATIPLKCSHRIRKADFSIPRFAWIR
jgi:hypothetical protein